jgi:hypothetical protein
MRPEVSRIEETLSVHLDEQHMGVKGTVIGQVGRNPKRSHLERQPALPESDVSIDRFAENSRGQLIQPPGRFPAEYRPVAGCFPQQAIMILMWVGD